MLSMNIFFLDLNPWTAAQCQHDRHVLSGIVETAQLLSTVWWKTWTSETIGNAERHKATFGIDPGHKNYIRHPLVVWAATSTPNYKWAIEYLQSLLLEHKLRWPHKPPHKYTGLEWIYNGTRPQSKAGLTTPPAIFGLTWTDPPQIVADCCKKRPEQFIEAYRDYYKHFKLYRMKELDLDKKLHLVPNTWTKRQMPQWLV